jgi:hypothetical protein
MFDLEQAIAEWRRQMLAGGIKTPPVLDELESHLREATAEQIQSGASPAQAFELAIRQIGPSSVLSAEFRKARIPDEAKLRIWGSLAYGAELIAYASLGLRYLLRTAPALGELILGAAALAATLLMAYAGWRLAPRVMKIISNKTARTSVAITGCVLSLLWLDIFAWFILPHFEFTPGQFAAIFLWAMLPVLTLPTLLFGIDQSESALARPTD